jgi:hypothetical protein
MLFHHQSAKNYARLPRITPRPGFPAVLLSFAPSFFLSRRGCCYSFTPAQAKARSMMKYAVMVAAQDTPSAR